MSGEPLSFGAKAQGLTAQSTVESELAALAYGSKEAMYLSNFMMELGFKIFSTVPINRDSTGALHLGGNATYSSRTEHITLRFFFLRELVKTAKIAIHDVDTGQMIADVATKCLEKVQHHKILQQIKELSR